MVVEVTSVFNVVHVPLTVKLPAIVISLGNPIWIWLLVTVVSISLDVPANVKVSVPNVTVSLLPLSAAIVKSVLIDDVVTLERRPSSKTVITGIAVELPYELAVTPVADNPRPVMSNPSAAVVLEEVKEGTVVLSVKDSR